jgi:hypothetical protein
MNTPIKLEDVLTFVQRCDEYALDQMANAIKLKRNYKAMQVKYQMGIGSTVQFTSAKKRSPFTYTAVITDKRQTRATVRITGPTWGKYAVGSLVTVPFAMLKEA